MVHQNNLDQDYCNICSKSTPIHGTLQESDLIYSYSISHFGWLSQAVAKKPIYNFNHKVSYVYNIVDPVINVFSPNELRGYFHICDHSIVTFGIRGFCLGVLNTSDVDSLDRFRKPVVDKFKTDV